MLEALIFGLLSGGIPYLILRRKTSVPRTLAAYAAGFVAVFGVAVGVFAFFDWNIVVPGADKILGAGFGFGLFGPIFGIAVARRTRRKAAADIT